MSPHATEPSASPSQPAPARGSAEGLGAWLAAWLGADVAETSPVSAERTPGAGWRAWRVTLADGRRFKLRRLRAAADGPVIAHLLGALAAAGTPGAARFAAVVDQRDDLLLEEWIDGVPLPDPPPDAVLAAAGDLLGRLHAHRAGGGASRAARVTTAEHRTCIERHLRVLAAAGALTAAEAESLRAAAVACDPGEAAAGFTHRDFCAENMLLDRDGRLVVIDNETMLTGPLDFDLARTDYRWALPPARRATFLRAYAAHRDPHLAPDAARFWKLRALTMSAHFRLRQAAGVDGVAAAVDAVAAAAVPLAALRGLAAELLSGGRVPA